MALTGCLKPFQPKGRCPQFSASSVTKGSKKRKKGSYIQQHTVSEILFFFSKCKVQLAEEAPITTASVTYSNLKIETSGICMKTNAIKPATMTVWVQFNTSRLFPLDVLPVFEHHMTWNEKLANDSLGSDAQEDVWHKEIRGSSIYYRLSNSTQQSSAVWGLWGKECATLHCNIQTLTWIFTATAPDKTETLTLDILSNRSDASLLLSFWTTSHKVGSVRRRRGKKAQLIMARMNLQISHSSLLCLYCSFKPNILQPHQCIPLNGKKNHFPLSSSLFNFNQPFLSSTPSVTLIPLPTPLLCVFDGGIRQGEHFLILIQFQLECGGRKMIDLSKCSIAISRNRGLGEMRSHLPPC